MAFNAFERMAARRYLGSRGDGVVSAIALFSFMGIALGVFALVVTMSVMSGFRDELLGRIVGVNGHALVAPPRGEVALRDFDRIAAGVGIVPGVLSATPYVEGQVLVTGERGATGGLLRGVRPPDFRARPVFLEPEAIVAGVIQDFGEPGGLFIGERLANRLGVWIGDDVRLLSPNGRPTPFGTMPTAKSYAINGVFNVGMFEYDSTFMFLPFEEAQAYLLLDDAATAVEVFVDQPDRIEGFRPILSNAAGADVRIVDWKLTNRSFVEALRVERI
ncbi:MAG: ABC transporter permease, partial [Pseudomonadota bacterium]